MRGYLGDKIGSGCERKMIPGVQIGGNVQQTIQYTSVADTDLCLHNNHPLHPTVLLLEPQFIDLETDPLIM